MRFKGNVGSVWNERAKCSIPFVDGVAEVTSPGDIDFLTRAGFLPVLEEEQDVPKKPGPKKNKR